MNTNVLAPEGTARNPSRRPATGVSFAALLVLFTAGAFFALQSCSPAAPGQAADPGGATAKPTTPPTAPTPPTPPTPPNNNPPPPT